jgi:hypothetical protein
MRENHGLERVSGEASEKSELMFSRLWKNHLLLPADIIFSSKPTKPSKGHFYMPA